MARKITLSRVVRKIKSFFLNRPYFVATEDIQIGRNVHFGKNVIFNCNRVRIGDGVIFQDNIIINADIFEIGDYGTVYNSCFFPGPGELRIGHNCWLGTGAIVDSMGGTIIGNNVCISTYCQLWTHMIFGDVMYGCQFHSVKPLYISDDVWLSSNCLVSPVKIGTRAIAMPGSVITRDLEPDHCYAGVPAIDVTDKLGAQFKITSVSDRFLYIKEKLIEFARFHDLDDVGKYVLLVDSFEDMPMADQKTVLNVKDRTYIKRGTEMEYKLLRYLLPEAKFVPKSAKQ